MSYINQVTHENEEIAKKVGYFADYFYFAANTLGQNDFVSIDNPLSLVEKILIQLHENLHHSPRYIQCYLSNEWFCEHEEFWSEFPSHGEVIPMRTKYLALTGEKRQRAWLTKNETAFIASLTKLQKELSVRMFDTALKNVVGYTKCEHVIGHHKKDFVWGINCMVTEFLLKDHSKKDLTSLFGKLLSKDADLFPFPPEIDTDEKRTEFLKARTFDQQFDGIKNSLKQQLKDYTFVFRVYNLSVPDNFKFNYHRVTFYSPNHPTVAGLRKTRFPIKTIEDFFGAKIGVLGCIKAQYHSLEIAKSDAVELLNREIQYLNYKLEANCYVDPFTALLTLDFSSTEVYTGAHRSSGVKVKSIDLDKLKDNPYVILKPYHATSKEHFLKTEPLYVEALTTKNPSTFWQYFETLLTPLDQPGGKNFPIVETVSSILLLNAEYHYKKKIVGPYIMNGFANSSPSFLGVSQQIWSDVFLQDWNEETFRQLRDETSHPFIKQLLDAYSDPFTKDQLLVCKQHYERVLWETKSERNFDTHSGKRNDKASILVENTLPRFGTRLRWLLFRGIEQNDGMDFHTIVTSLAQDGAELLNKKGEATL